MAALNELNVAWPGSLTRVVVVVHFDKFEYCLFSIHSNGTTCPPIDGPQALSSKLSACTA